MTRNAMRAVIVFCLLGCACREDNAAPSSATRPAPSTRHEIPDAPPRSPSRPKLAPGTVVRHPDELLVPEPPGLHAWRRRSMRPTVRDGRMSMQIFQRYEGAAAIAFVREGDDGLTVLSGELFSFGGAHVDLMFDLWSPRDASFALVGVRADVVKGDSTGGHRNASYTAHVIGPESAWSAMPMGVHFENDVVSMVSSSEDVSLEVGFAPAMQRYRFDVTSKVFVKDGPSGRETAVRNRSDR
jgi:hypothetical protein